MKKTTYREELSKGSISDRFEQLRQNDVTVATVMHHAGRIGLDTVDALRYALLAMAEARTELAKRVLRAEQISPKIVVVDGKKFRWDAPDELVELIKSWDA